MEKYSILASLYKNSIKEEVEEALQSIFNQTYLSDQIVLVFDGPIPNDTKAYIEDLQKTHKEIEIVDLKENVGLGKALAAGMEHCRNEIVVRVDTDDISVPDRCQKQVEFMVNNPEYGAISSNICEFIDNIDNVVAERDVPQTHEEICEYLKKRCPLNHMAAVLRKGEVQKAGGYQHWYLDEDSFLWVRMYLAGSKFYNIQEDLVYARVGRDMYARRGGYKYYKSERDLFKYMLDNKVIGVFGYLEAIAIRFVVQVLMPNKVREWFFKTFARREKK